MRMVSWASRVMLGARSAQKAASLSMAAMVVMMLAGCAFYPPNNLGELRSASADLRGAKVLVSFNPQIQLDGEAKLRAAGQAKPGATIDDYYGRLLAQLRQRLEERGVGASTELRDLNSFSAPPLAAVVQREKSDYVLRMRQERMGFVNGQEADVVWLLELARVRPSPGQQGPLGDVVFQHRYAVGGAFCLGQKLIQAAEPTAMECLKSQADHIVARLAANGYFSSDGQAPEKPASTGLLQSWSEPPVPRTVKDSSSKSLACMNNVQGVKCN